jgi:hypothetical protein
LYGPGRTRTCDLGIKSPARQAEANCAELKRAANRAVDRCNEPQLIAGCGAKPVRPPYARYVNCVDNGLRPLLAKARVRGVESRRLFHAVERSITSPARRAASRVARHDGCRGDCRTSPVCERLHRVAQRSGVVVAPRRGVRARMRGSLAAVCVLQDGTIVGMGRLVGDGAMYCFAVDVVVIHAIRGGAGSGERSWTIASGCGSATSRRTDRACCSAGRFVLLPATRLRNGR